MPAASVHAMSAPSWHGHPRDPRPLAERLEALLRVVENPAPFAQRLARRLYDEEGPALLARVLDPLPRSPADPDGALLAPLQRECVEALVPRDTS